MISSKQNQINRRISFNSWINQSYPKMYHLVTTIPQVIILQDKKNLSTSYSPASDIPTLVTINPAVYLPWLLKQFLNLEGKMERRKVDSLSQVTDGVDVVVNCTGIHARDLVGDKSVVWTRGQNVLIKASHIRKTMIMDSK